MLIKEAGFVIQTLGSDWRKSPDGRYIFIGPRVDGGWPIWLTSKGINAFTKLDFPAVNDRWAPEVVEAWYGPTPHDEPPVGGLDEGEPLKTP